MQNTIPNNQDRSYNVRSIMKMRYDNDMTNRKGPLYGLW